jgi:hypothetical protein
MHRRSVGTVCAVAAAAASAVFACASALAHHSFAAEFAIDKPIELTGKITRVEWVNPHSWFHMEVVGDDGQAVTWMVEGGSPNALVRRGITKNSIPIGSELIVRGYGTRDGSNKAVGRDMKFADGRELFFGGTQAPGDAPQPQ